MVLSKYPNKCIPSGQFVIYTSLAKFGIIKEVTHM